MGNDFLIDTHCHLHDLEWFTPAQQAEFLAKAHDNRVRELICIGTNPVDSFHAQSFAESREGVFWTFGVHPELANDNRGKCSSLTSLVKNPADSTTDPATKPLTNHSACATLEAESELQEPGTDFDDPEFINFLQAQSAKLVAVGEIGLDYHYEGYDRAAQIKLFEQMLQLAQDLQLPVSLHIREAFADAWPVLDNFPRVKGVVHSFTGSRKDLRQALERDFFIGVNGLVTYTTPPLPPLEKIVLETDAPFLTPVPFRGTINSPAYVQTIAAYLAGKLGEAEDNIVEQTTKNARTVFKI